MNVQDQFGTPLQHGDVIFGVDLNGRRAVGTVDHLSDTGYPGMQWVSVTPLGDILKPDNTTEILAHNSVHVTLPAPQVPDPGQPHDMTGQPLHTGDVVAALSHPRTGPNDDMFDPDNAATLAVGVWHSGGAGPDTVTWVMGNTRESTTPSNSILLVIGDLPGITGQ